jgi:hypothetical protein
MSKTLANLQTVQTPVEEPKTETPAEPVNPIYQEADLKTVLAKDTNELPEKYRGLKNTSEKIRAMTADGYKTAAIAKLLKYEDGRNLRYQHVRNVQKQPLKKPAA